MAYNLGNDNKCVLKKKQQKKQTRKISTSDVFFLSIHTFNFVQNCEITKKH